ncbi:hypothetical protein [Pasteurella multocida]|uniref:hypothetical protein n=1 Tax=Pasteurella multocida TaxID=747 RepID=UPI0029B60238|nr:hypothetical protein [Pasteurella multocida]MDX3898709.1 hypothetical protein [Pasteurella multocida]MDX3956596.1 hypothetical protein [Pasteurella multocida]HDR1420257.1 hypothetical protein [Pasteurella multocida]HDR1425103.1 hypothetical protein [Pasteurella multocida]HDR1428979.1 hypothetical protein [Pasteurella multocida]
MKGTRESLLNNKPRLKKIEINGAEYYLRELTVGEVNEQLYGQQQRLIKLAKSQGIELNLDDAEELAKQLSQIYDPHTLARILAIRLCDENGENLFDAENEEDLTALSQLDKAVFEKLTQAIKTEEEEAKN